MPRVGRRPACPCLACPWLARSWRGGVAEGLVAPPGSAGQPGVLPQRKRQEMAGAWSEYRRVSGALPASPRRRSRDGRPDAEGGTACFLPIERAKSYTGVNMGGNDLNRRSDRPESGGADKDMNKEKSGILERDKQK